MNNKKGRIVRIISNLYTVESDNETYNCQARGKFRNDKIMPKVGDFVVFDYKELVIKKIMPRKNDLNRPCVSNIDVGIIVTSVKEPNLSLNLLDRELVSLISQNIEPIICLTKLDLLDDGELLKIKDIFAYYKKIGIDAVRNNKLDELYSLLSHKFCVVTGQTGAGKSTLLNKMDKSLNLDSNPISKALGRGVHTTRHTQMYKIKDFYIIDTPGFSSLNLDMKKDELKNYYPDFKVDCKFKDCQHDKEIGCMVKYLVETGDIMKSRYDNYIKIRSELKDEDEYR